MQNINQALQVLGLTPNESSIYTYLVRSGSKSGPEVFLECGIDKSSCYRSLKDLIQKGLIYSIGETRNQKFAAYPTNSLKEFQEKKQKEIIDVGSQIQIFAKDIESYVKNNYQSQRINLYSGKDGYVSWMESRLIDKVDIIRESLSHDYGIDGYDGEKNYYIQMPNYVERRVAKKIVMRTLANAGEQLDFIDRTRKDILKEVRRLHVKIEKPAGFSTWGDNLGLITRDKGGFLGIVIRDALLTKMMNGMFDFMWSTAEEVLPDENK